MMIRAAERDLLALQNMMDSALLDSLGFHVYQEAGKASQPNLASHRLSSRPTLSSIAIRVSI